MIEIPLNEDSLGAAIRRIYDFAAVHQHGDATDRDEALTVLRESLGITDEVLLQFTGWIEEFIGDESAGALLGLMVGLIAADHESQP